MGSDPPDEAVLSDTSDPPHGSGPTTGRSRTGSDGRGAPNQFPEHTWPDPRRSPSSRRSAPSSATPTPRSSPSTAASPSPSWRPCAGRCGRRPPSTRSSRTALARRAAEEAGLTELAELLQGPTAIAFVRGDAVTAAKALRDFGRTSPALVVKGGLLGPRVLTPARHRGARRHRAPRGAAGSARRRLPGPARQGGRAVPGVHPQLRLRREGADRPAGRRRRGLARAAPRRRAKMPRAAASPSRRSPSRPKPQPPKPQPPKPDAPRRPRPSPKHLRTRPRSSPSPSNPTSSQPTGEPSPWQP